MMAGRDRLAGIEDEVRETLARRAAEDELMRQLEPTLDPGIRSAVRILRRAGAETYESCQGGEGHCFPEPTVRFNGSRGEAMVALGAAFTHCHEIGLAVYELRRVWRVDEGDLTGPWWDLVFRPPEKPIRSELR